MYKETKEQRRERYRLLPRYSYVVRIAKQVSHTTLPAANLAIVRERATRLLAKLYSNGTLTDDQLVKQTALLDRVINDILEHRELIKLGAWTRPEKYTIDPDEVLAQLAPDTYKPTKRMPTPVDTKRRAELQKIRRDALKEQRKQLSP